MGFFNRLRKGTLFFGKKEPRILVEFNFRGKKYILEEFDIEFSQSVDYRNKPNGAVSGGNIYITFSETPDETINIWMMNATEKRDGEFRFLSNEGKIVEGAQLLISFKQGYCVKYSKIINPTGGGILTSIEIKPKYVRIGNEEFENDWR